MRQQSRRPAEQRERKNEHCDVRYPHDQDSPISRLSLIPAESRDIDTSTKSIAAQQLWQLGDGLVAAEERRLGFET
jgi:hypothetical protein